ncbi:hypothetical protein ACJ73_03501 [Blastomyces percursus]|uniref:DRBM domain-containing protein n=1 Tax=Blastomyces percursus TaxID=1658174 RepID=A0A1J9RBT8_9EURO|nr:hypothetical protein ACJ73_03501 [Blastomyces percursus]
MQYNEKQKEKRNKGEEEEIHAASLNKSWPATDAFTSTSLLPSGGRTAWSSTVTIQGTSFAARYFYDGQNTNNAKEDAAEVALTALRSQGAPSTTTFAGQLYAQNQGANSHSRWN